MHVDATLLIERPKRAPYKEAIHYAPLGALGVAPDRVNVKASNGEG